jgi:Uri superfamily endonuclease
MMATVTRRAISYQLHIDVPRLVRCTVGRFGVMEFPTGRYVYTGSARRGLEARIARHLSSRKTLRWHIDHLLAAPGVVVVGVVRSQCPECALNRLVRGSTPVPGFGASDCRAGCGAHLKLVGS